MRNENLAGWCGVCLLMLAAAATSADSITRKNGAVINGQIVAERPDAVVIEVESQGIVFRQTVPRAQIRSMQRDKAAAGPAYCQLPVQGVIGTDVTADALMAGFSEARAQHADYVVLVFDSLGGDIAEMNKILDVMRSNRDLKPIAYVKHAISAAAVIAMSCPRICMGPDGTIGAAVPYHLGPNGTPELIEEKFQSIVRAQMRAAAQLGGHSELWVRGMSEPDIELATDTRRGKPVLLEASDAPDGTIIKRKGQILSATASEAKAGGLSLGTVATVDDLRKPLNISQWHSTGDRAWFAVVNKASASKNHKLAQAKREAYIQRAGPAAARIEAQIQQLSATADAAGKAAAKLREEWQQQNAPIEAEYQSAIDQAQGTNEYALIQARADRIRQRKLKVVADRYQPQVVQYESIRDESLARIKQLTAQEKQLADNQPQE